MWQHETVERALFRWKGWRQTIVSQWIASDRESLSVVESEARGQLQSLGLPESYPLEVYWVSTVVSDVCFSDESSFARIVVPAGLGGKYIEWLADHDLSPGNRFLPPQVWSEKDILLFYERLGIPPDRISYPPESFYIYLPSGHDFYSVLGGLRGRPKKGTGKRGKTPIFPDRIAVKCACKRPHMTYVEIARELGLPTHTYYFSEQSDTARHLVARGRSLLEEFGLEP